MDKDSNAKSKENRATQGPLSGIKVIDWTLWQFGPVAAMMLGDLGADVIKVEALSGEQGRAMFTLSGIDRSLPGGRNSYWLRRPPPRDCAPPSGDRPRPA